MVVLIVLLFTFGITFGFLALFFLTDYFETDSMDSLAGAIVIGIGSVALIFAGTHNVNWETRKEDFANRYEVTRLVSLTDDKAVWINEDEEKCSAKVTYKNSNPHGELFIVKNSTKCVPMEDINEGEMLEDD